MRWARATLGPVTFAAGIAASSLLAARGAAARPEPQANVEASASANDPFPLDPEDPRVRVFETHHGQSGGQGIVVYESFISGRERLENGRDYSILETRARARNEKASRLISREWLRRDEHGIFCARRQEGPTVSDLDPEQCVVKLPIELHAAWSWTGSAGGIPCRSDNAVVACEELTVPAGTFPQTWRIESTVRSTNGDDLLRRTIWLTGGLGLIQERSQMTVCGRGFLLDARLQGLADRSIVGSSSSRRHS